MQRQKPTEDELVAMRKKHNPKNEPVGHFTGRCGQCGSTNLWDDAAAYGCDSCGEIFFTGSGNVLFASRGRVS